MSEVSAANLSPEPKKSGRIGKAGIAPVLALILGGIYAVEGGYTNDRNDPGGATNYGVTESVARKAGYRGDMRYFPKHCDGPAEVCADDIYIRDYIQKPGYIPMVTVSPAVADKMANTTVNMGMSRPNRWFRETLGLPGTGGPLGLVEYSAYHVLEGKLGVTPACETVLKSIGAKQEAEYYRLIRINVKLAKFRNGWVARARNLHPSGIPCGVTP